MKWSGVATECRACHTDVHLGQITGPCEACHTAQSFHVPTYRHRNRSLFDFFAGRHVTATCEACHKPATRQFPAGRGTAIVFQADTRCVACHRDVHRGALGSELHQLSPTMKRRFWLIVLVALVVAALWPRLAETQFETPNRAFHNATAFKLEGKHLTLPCESCHLNGQYRGTPTTCYSCHWVRRKDDRFQTRLGTECESCHRPISWTAVRWDHGAQAGMPLNADHRLLGCESCHRTANFRSASLSCVSCHQKDFDRTQSPNHRTAGFPATCESCHRPSDSTWQGSVAGGFSHAAVFPLVGNHATLACQSCHKNNVYRGTPRDCVGCHLPNYTSAQNPNHVAASFPTTCESCHRPTDPQWRGTRLQSQRGVRLGRRSCHAGLRHVPQEQCLPRDAA